MSWRHVDLRQQFVAVLQPPDVDEHREQQRQPEHHRSGAAIESDTEYSVGHDLDDDRSDQGFRDRAAATPEAVAAEHGRGQRRDLQSHSVSVPAPLSRAA